MADENENKDEPILLTILKFIIGLIWDYIKQVIKDAIKYAGLPFLAFVLVICLGFMTYCFITGTPIDTIQFIPELLSSVIEDFLNGLQEAYPGIENYIAGATTFIEFLRTIWPRIKEKLLNKDKPEENSGDQNGNSSPQRSSVPKKTKTYIRAGLYTHDFNEIRGTVVQNGRTLVNSVKISCKITNDNPKTEKVIFESCVFIPEINKVEFLKTVVCHVKPLDTVDVNNPCPVDIDPIQFASLPEERWIICIRANRKTVYKEEFYCPFI